MSDLEKLIVVYDEAKEPDLSVMTFGFYQEDGTLNVQGMLYDAPAGYVFNLQSQLSKAQATIQQLAEALRNINPVLFNAWNCVHCLPRETDSVLASHIEGAQRTIKQALTAAEPYLTKQEKGSGDD